MQLDDEEIPDEVAKVVAYLFGMKFASHSMAIYCLCQGFAIVFGNDQRFSAQAYQVAAKVPGAPDIWGFVLLACGVIAMYGIASNKDNWASIGMIAAGLWSAAFGTSFLLAALEFPNANLTAIFTYALQSILFLVAGVVFHSAHKKGSRVPRANH